MGKITTLKKKKIGFLQGKQPLSQSSLINNKKIQPIFIQHQSISIIILLTTIK